MVADAGYGSAEMLGWLVEERGIEPYVKVFDKSERTDGTFSRGDFAFDAERSLYVCPEGKELKPYRRAFSTLRDDVKKNGTIRYLASKLRCEARRPQIQVLSKRCLPRDCSDGALDLSAI